MITVVAALIEKEGKYLLAKRITGSEEVIGKWEFPGGKVNPNEDEICAIEREIKEEFEIDVKATKFIANSIYQYPSKIINLKLYKCIYKDGDFKLHVHSEYIFVNKTDILKYDLCPADIQLAKIIKEMK